MFFFFGKNFLKIENNKKKSIFCGRDEQQKKIKSWEVEAAEKKLNKMLFRSIQ